VVQTLSRNSVTRMAHASPTLRLEVPPLAGAYSASGLLGGGLRRRKRLLGPHPLLPLFGDPCPASLPVRRATLEPVPCRRPYVGIELIPWRAGSTSLIRRCAEESTGGTCGKSVLSGDSYAVRRHLSIASRGYGGCWATRQAEGRPVPYQTRALEVLAQWRAVERALAGVDAGTLEADDLRAEVFRLRDEYQELILAARRNDAPEPPPFPLE
jgi:hypothetical protein